MILLLFAITFNALYVFLIFQRINHVLYPNDCIKLRTNAMENVRRPKPYTKCLTENRFSFKKRKPPHKKKRPRKRQKPKPCKTSPKTITPYKKFIKSALVVARYLSAKVSFKQNVFHYNKLKLVLQNYFLGSCII